MSETLRVTWHNSDQANASFKSTVVPFVKRELDAGRPLSVQIIPLEDARSLLQNKFYWAVVLKQTSQQAKLNGIGATADGWHLYFKREHLGYSFRKTTLPGKTRPSVIKELKSTKDLSVKAMSVYLEKCMAQAATDFGVMFGTRRWEDYQVDAETGEIINHH